MKFFWTTMLAATVFLPLSVFAQGWHDPSSTLSYTPSGYTALANMRQASTAATFAKNTITTNDAADCFVTFGYSTFGKNIFVVYTTDGTNPDKSKTSVACAWSNTTDDNNTWVGSIPMASNTAGATIKYVFYISDGTLANAWGRVALSGYSSGGWTEGDSYFSYTVSAAHFADANTTSYGSLSELLNNSQTSARLLASFDESDDVSLSNSFSLDLGGFTYGGGKKFTIASNKKLTINGYSGTFDNQIIFGSSTSELAFISAITLGSNFSTKNSTSSGKLLVGDGTTSVIFPLSNSGDALSKVSTIIVKGQAALTLSTDGTSSMPTVEINDGGTVNLTTGTYENSFASTASSSASTAQVTIGTAGSEIVTTTGDWSGYFGKVNFMNGAKLTLSPVTATTVAARFEIGGSSATGTQTLTITSVSMLTSDVGPITLDKYGVLDLSGLTTNIAIVNGNVVLNNASAVSHAPLVKFGNSIITCQNGKITGSGMTLSNWDFSAVSLGTIVASMTDNPSCSGFIESNTKYVSNTYDGIASYSIKLIDPIFYNGTDYFATFSDLLNATPTSGALRKDCTEASDVTVAKDFALDLNGFIYGGGKTISINDSKTLQLSGTSGTFDNKISFSGTPSELMFAGSIGLGSNFTTSGSTASGRLSIGDGSTTASFSLSNSGNKFTKVGKVYVKNQATVTLVTDGSSAMPDVDVADGGIVKLSAGTYANTFTTATATGSSTATMIVGNGASATVTTTGDLSAFFGTVSLYDGSTLTLSPTSATTVAAQFHIGNSSGTSVQTLAVTSVTAFTPGSSINPIQLAKYGKLDLSGLTSDLKITTGDLTMSTPAAVANAPVIKFSGSHTITWEAGGMAVSGTGSITVEKNFDVSSVSAGTIFAITSAPVPCTGLTADGNWYVKSISGESPWSLQLMDPVFTDGTNYFATFNDLSSSVNSGTLRKDYSQTSSYSMWSDFSLDLGGHIFSGAQTFTVGANKTFTVKGSGTFDNVISFGSGNSMFTLIGSVGVGSNFTTSGSSASGILAFGDGSIATSFTMQVADLVYNGIGSVQIRSNATLTISTAGTTSQAINIASGGTVLFSGTGTYDNIVEFSDATSVLKLVGTIALGSSFGTTTSGSHGTLTIGDGTTSTPFSMANGDAKFSEVTSVNVSNSANLTLTTGGSELKTFNVNDGGTLLLTSGTYANTFTSTTANSTSTAQIIVGAGASAAVIATGDLSAYFGLVNFYDASSFTLSPSVSTVASRFVIGGSGATATQTLSITSATLNTGSSEANSITMDKYGKVNLINLTDNLTIGNGSMQLLNANGSNAPVIRFSAIKKLLMTDAVKGGITGDNISADNFDFSSFTANTTFAQLALAPVLTNATTSDGKTVGYTGSGPYDVTLSDPTPAVEVVATTGTTTGTYWSLKKAFDAVNVGTHTGVVDIKITQTHETASAVLNASGSGGGASYTALSLYPTVTGLSVHGNIEAPIIDLNGAQNVTIDGRVNKTGAVKDLCIYNENTSSTIGTSTIRFINGASSNTVQYCLVKGSGAYPDENEGGGIVFFATSTTVGNSNNTITHNSFTNYAGNRPTAVIFSKGTENKDNSGTTISNNVFYDHFNAGYASSGINLYFATTGCTITGNSFYETTTFVPTAGEPYVGIKINYTSGNNFVVSGNTIGGNAPGNTGTMTVNAAVGHSFAGVFLMVGTTVASSVQNNTITNIAYTSSSTKPWYGIAFIGNVNVGTEIGNTIGSATGTGSITVTNTSANATSYGIASMSTGTVNIQKNTIASFTTVGSTSVGHSFYGIDHNGNGAVLNISNNTIGSTEVASSIDANSVNSSGSSGINVCGIRVVNNASTTIAGNTIANMRNQATDNLGTSTTTGIIAENGTPTITGNIVRNLYNACAGSGASVSGIYISRNLVSSDANISSNTLYTLCNTNESYTGSVTGLNLSDIGTSESNVVAKNLIRDLRVASTSSSAAIYGLVRDGGSATYSNNAISLGSSITNGNVIIGIKSNPSGSRTNLYYNTVNIEGTTTGTTGSTYALSNPPSEPRNYRNNIFSNSRAGGSGGTHYAVSLSNKIDLTIDYNDYYAPNGVLGKMGGTEYSTLVDWRTATGADLHSSNKIVYFVSSTDLNLTGASIGDGALIGTPISGITTDIVGTTRSGEYPYMGAYENTTSPLPVELVSFTACAQNNGVTVNWQTATELNSYGFEIQRRGAAASEFMKVGFVEGRGTSNSPSVYSFNDRNPAGGKVVYRLKSMDNDGSFTYSNEVTVTAVPMTYDLAQNFPNPFNPSTTISFSLPAKTRLRLDVYNAVGQLVTTLVDEEREPGYYQVQWNAAGAASGMYFYRIATSKFTSVKKMMLLK